ncbi:MAG: hypothetical protein ACLFSL_03815 [Candidatus Woesearchaeota archaeon]
MFTHHVLWERIGRFTGFTLSFVIFSMMLFFFMSMMGKIPDTWSFFDIFYMTLPLLLVAYLVRRWLE